MNQLQEFLEFAKTNYPECTLEQKLGAYLQHHPVRALPFLLELLVEFELYPKDPTDDPADTSG